MILKRGILISLVSYLTFFLVGFISNLFLGINFSKAAYTTLFTSFASICCSISFGIIFTLWYFQNLEIERNLKEGFYFSLILILVGSFIDSLFVIPYILINGDMGELLFYYSHPLFWVSFVLIFVTPSCVGYYLSRKNKTSKNKTDKFNSKKVVMKKTNKKSITKNKSAKKKVSQKKKKSKK